MATVHRPIAQFAVAPPGVQRPRALRASAAACLVGQGAPTIHAVSSVTTPLRTLPVFSSPVQILPSQGLASGTKGMAGLARTNTAVHTQLTSAFKLPNKFALCMPSSSKSFPGVVFLGGGSYYIFDHPTENPKDYSKSLISTPLITNPVNTAPICSKGDPSDEYFVGVKSISVNDQPVPFKTSLLSIDKKGVGGTILSTIIPYTVLHTTIYKALASALKKIKRVPSVAPLGACFSSRTIASSQTGPAVPVINLVLHDKTSRWRIYGANSMAKVKKDVLCLGFVDDGSEPRTSIVLGGYQLENYLVEFDLTSSKFRFSNSLLLANLMTTPLILNPVNNSPTRVGLSNIHSDEYFIGVKSIHVDRKHVSFKESLLSINKKGIGGTKLSTLAPYTILQTSIYKALVKDFVKTAASRKIKRVTSVAPFGACFSSKTIASSQTGPAVPVIQLQLQSKSLYFRIYGANSMVEVEKDVLCLGFMDGGSNPTTSVFLGGHLLENYLLEFDLASSKLGTQLSGETTIFVTHLPNHYKQMRVNSKLPNGPVMFMQLLIHTQDRMSKSRINMTPNYQPRTDYNETLPFAIPLAYKSPLIWSSERGAFDSAVLLFNFITFLGSIQAPELDPML
ncbi:hypothetical protein RJ639_004083 [Escallonia herrerae]|uniref:Peptidase A1 domain-containing protein n=1 Tax=Escallonia herrerae TaxID=1293975 RepID=A0AA88W5I3_9ASTE|nr:hypothetical protein RJ639_004083 [Escallonia herrerae]